MNEEMNVSAATALKYLADGRLDVVRGPSGTIIGLWVETQANRFGEYEHAIVRAFCSILKVAQKEGRIPYSLPKDIEDALFVGNYRIVENTFDNRGGRLVLVGVG